MRDIVWFYPIDWTATGSMLAGIGTVVLAGAALSARNEFKDWQKKQVFRDRRNIAVDALSIAYEADQIFDRIRFGAYMNNEVLEAAKVLKMDPYLEDMYSNKRVHSQIFLNRINQYQGYWERLHALLPRVEAFLGGEIKKQLLEIPQLKAKIANTAFMHANTSDIELEKQQRDVLISGHAGSEVDPISEKILHIKTCLEGELLPLIRGEDVK